jgi:hypothetical protein
VRFFFDNNLSHHLAHAMRELSAAEPEVTSVEHLTDRFRRNCPDVEWISALASERGWVIISQDRLRKNDLEREALRASGLVVFSLDRNWASQEYWLKAQNLVKWWPAIMEQCVRIEGGAAFRVPWRFTGKGRFEQIRL